MLPFPAFVVFRNLQILSLAVKGAAGAQNYCCLNSNMYQVEVQGKNTCRMAYSAGYFAHRPSMKDKIKPSCDAGIPQPDPSPSD